MAGGVGSRFWPMSTAEKPKQFIDVLGVGRTLLQLTFDRFEGLCDPKNVWVVTNKKYIDIVHEQLPQVPGLGISPGEENGNPLQYSCLKNPMDRGVWWTMVPGVTESRTGLSDWTRMHMHVYIKEWLQEGVSIR